MVASENIKEFNSLMEEIFHDYIVREQYELNIFKQKLRDFVSNPLSSDKRLHKLITLMEDKNGISENCDSLWNQIEDLISEKYLKKKIKKKLQEGKIRNYEKKLIEFLVEIGKKKGTNETLSAIIGYFLIHKRLTQSQLKELSGFSKGAISENLKILAESRFVHKELIEGTRKYQYSIGDSMSYVAENVSLIKSLKAEELLNFANKKISQLKAMDNKKKPGYDLLLKRLEELKEFCKLLENILNTVINSDQIKSIRGEKNKLA
ncbi:MAG: transcriptional regulator [Promethearchaeota archaeon]|nr:MAG: transcriptional regulator [Candidatus Lokiarchaeota archaeon]